MSSTFDQYVVLLKDLQKPDLETNKRNVLWLILSVLYAVSVIAILSLELNPGFVIAGAVFFGSLAAVVFVRSPRSFFRRRQDAYLFFFETGDVHQTLCELHRRGVNLKDKALFRVLIDETILHRGNCMRTARINHMLQTGTYPFDS